MMRFSTRGRNWKGLTAKMRYTKSAPPNGNHSARKAIVCIETNVEYKSLTEASKQLSIEIPRISDCLRGKIKDVKGFTFRYKQND